MSQAQVAALLKQPLLLPRAVSEPIQTSNQFDGTAKNPQWLDSYSVWTSTLLTTDLQHYHRALDVDTRE